LRRADDLTLPSSIVTTNVAEFGDAWKTNFYCNHGELTTGLHVDACAMGSTYIVYAQQQCAVLKEGKNQAL